MNKNIVAETLAKNPRLALILMCSAAKDGVDPAGIGFEASDVAALLPKSNDSETADLVRDAASAVLWNNMKHISEWGQALAKVQLHERPSIEVWEADGLKASDAVLREWIDAGSARFDYDAVAKLAFRRPGIFTSLESCSILVDAVFEGGSSYDSMGRTLGTALDSGHLVDVLLRRGLDNRDFGKLCEIAGCSGNVALGAALCDYAEVAGVSIPDEIVAGAFSSAKLHDADPAHLVRIASVCAFECSYCGTWAPSDTDHPVFLQWRNENSRDEATLSAADLADLWEASGEVPALSVAAFRAAIPEALNKPSGVGKTLGAQAREREACRLDKTDFEPAIDGSELWALLEASELGAASLLAQRDAGQTAPAKSKPRRV